jgi:HEAT repeat protein
MRWHTDPADSLYRVARQELNRGNYQRAADLFRRIREEHRESRYVADSYYWEAFALYRSGDPDRWESALDLLDTQENRYPEASTRADAESLYVMIRGRLAGRGNAAAAQDITERARLQEGACPQDEDDVRVMALNALLNMDAERAVPILRQVLERRDECSVELRRKAVFLVSQKHSGEATTVLLDVVRTDPDPEVQEQAVFWLSQVHSTQAVNALDSILMESDNQRIQEKAIFALSQHSSGRAGEILRRFVMRQDVSEELREDAIFWLGQSHSRENVEFLKELYGQVNSPALKDKIIFSISQQESADGAEWLMNLALNENESIKARKQALFWAGQQRRIPTDRLSELYSSMPDIEMREQVIFVLSQRHEREAVDVLMGIARSETDPDLQKKAIFWLGQSNDPRVAEFLLEIINRPIPQG